MSKTDEWPFDQKPETAALTTRQVLEATEPIRQVVHYGDDRSWAFTHGTSDEKEDYRIVHMGELLQLDETLRSIGDLLPGWSAWRDTIGDDWERVEESVEEY